MMGGGIRGTIEQLDLELRERIRAANLEFLRTNQVRELDVNVLYAIAQK
jgi:hypothetical protein